jgi:nitrite reductase (NADH) large subunit
MCLFVIPVIFDYYIYMNYVIIGNGIAGVTAAATIREHDPGGEIVIISDEPYPFYNRMRLIEYLSGTLNDDDLILKDKDWYKEQKIMLMTGTVVKEIDANNRSVMISDDDYVSYDRLLLATGGVSFIPPIKGADKGGVFALRTLDDAKAINAHVRAGHRKVVLIGGGVLGLEAGYNLIKAGCSVTVVEFFPRLLPRQMDADGASILQAQMEGMGFTFHLGVKTERITGDDHVTGIELDNGTQIEGDTVLISAGVRPRADLAQKFGLEIDKGVVVNERLETSVQDVFAAGDLIEHNGVFYGIWPASEKQGEIAGITMTGGEATYGGTTVSNVLKVAGVSLAAMGSIDAEGDHDSIIKADREAFRYKKLVLDNNRIIGAILYGDIKDLRRITAAIEEKKDIGPIRSELETWNLDRL